MYAYIYIYETSTWVHVSKQKLFHSRCLLIAIDQRVFSYFSKFKTRRVYV
jgi:hypothetical protein